MKERDFSRKLRKALRAEGFSVRPVETGGTNVGFPDLFVAGSGIATFIEVKSRPGMTIAEVQQASGDLLGPGQRQFAREFAAGTASGHGDGRHCLVAASCSDGFLTMRVDRDGSLQSVAACRQEGEQLALSSWIRAAVIAGYFGKAEGIDGRE